MIKNNIKFILGIIFGFVLAGSVVYAITLSSEEVTYDNSKSHLKDANNNDVDNVKDAIDVLYTKASNSGNGEILADFIYDILCPGCVYAFPTEEWYFSSKTLTTSDYKTDYKEIMAQTGKNYFIGIVLNGNMMSREFACGFVDDVPYCIEGMKSGNSTLNTNNLRILQSKYLFSNSCTLGNSTAQHYVCAKTNALAETNIYGYAISGNDYTNQCMVRNNYGYVICK